eukprot:scaffold1736_cov127-Cylindrotheca_fusiformis.AAC.59
MSRSDGEVLSQTRLSYRSSDSVRMYWLKDTVALAFITSVRVDVYSTEARTQSVNDLPRKPSGSRGFTHLRNRED